MFSAANYTRNSSSEKDTSDGVKFQYGLPGQLVSIDGTWSRKVTLLDISKTDAHLRLEESVAGLDLKEFFLLLTNIGTVFRRCKLVWLDQDEVEVLFLSRVAEKKGRSRQRA